MNQADIIKLLFGGIGGPAGMELYKQEQPRDMMTGQPYLTKASLGVPSVVERGISPALAARNEALQSSMPVGNQPQFNSRAALESYSGPDYAGMKRGENEGIQDFVSRLLLQPTGTGELSEKFMSSWEGANKASAIGNGMVKQDDGTYATPPPPPPPEPTYTYRSQTPRRSAFVASAPIWDEEQQRFIGQDESGNAVYDTVEDSNVERVAERAKINPPTTTQLAFDPSAKIRDKMQNGRPWGDYLEAAGIMPGPAIVAPALQALKGAGLIGTGATVAKVAEAIPNPIEKMSRSSSLPGFGQTIGLGERLSNFANKAKETIGLGPKSNTNPMGQMLEEAGSVTNLGKVEKPYWQILEEGISSNPVTKTATEIMQEGLTNSDKAQNFLKSFSGNMLGSKPVYPQGINLQNPLLQLGPGKSALRPQFNTNIPSSSPIYVDKAGQATLSKPGNVEFQNVINFMKQNSEGSNIIRQLEMAYGPKWMNRPEAKEIIQNQMKNLSLRGAGF